ncbi:hypothetical protein THIX_60490 [Thiomonas sp. X19]|uniref:hypothetical protein n=1 Tax=Thiomonas sp. X19 TaxID=1050370 RepID=UPI000B70BF02|nr:hypothetical protein [Thiomonas sp. X19]SCC94432.1 hypothetical protein THIX_60490 [Thiomonas sp. X19]
MSTETEDKRELTAADKHNLARVARMTKAEKAAATDWEKDFLKKLGERYAKWKDKVFLSEKQSAALAKIVAALDAPPEDDLPDPNAD